MQLAEIKQDLQKENFKTKFLQMAQISESTFQKEMAFALQQVKSNPKIMECSRESVLTAIMNVAQIGLTLNPTQKQAYLIPRWSRNGSIAHLEPSYIGLISLAVGKSIRQIDAYLVNEGDVIEMEGQMKVKEHSPYWLNGNEKGGIMGVYSKAILIDGSESWEFMGMPEIEKIKSTSESWKAFKKGNIKSCIWIDHEGEMIRKTIIRRHLKRLQGDNEKLSNAIDLMESDWKEEASFSHVSYAQSLIDQSNLSDEVKSNLESELAHATKERVNEIIEQATSSMPNEGKTKQGLDAAQTQHLDSIDIN